jgi:hypothetical protein
MVEVWSKPERKKRAKKCSNPKGFTMKQFCKNMKTRSKPTEKKNESTETELRSIVKEMIELLLATD